MNAFEEINAMVKDAQSASIVKTAGAAEVNKYYDSMTPEQRRAMYDNLKRVSPNPNANHFIRRFEHDMRLQQQKDYNAIPEAGPKLPKTPSAGRNVPPVRKPSYRIPPKPPAHTMPLPSRPPAHTSPVKTRSDEFDRIMQNAARITGNSFTHGGKVQYSSGGLFR